MDNSPAVGPSRSTIMYDVGAKAPIPKSATAVNDGIPIAKEFREELKHETNISDSVDSRFSSNETQNNKDLSLDPEIYRKMKEKLDEYKCPICMEVLVKTSMVSCGHRFCLYCIKQWFYHSYPRRLCPVCRKNCMYFQDDSDTDVKISNIVQCLPRVEQEERSMTILDRDYLSSLPLTTGPKHNLCLDGFVDELSQSWASSQYSTDFVSTPFDVEPVNPIMTDSYYPPFQQYASYEPSFATCQDHPNVSVAVPLPLPTTSTVQASTTSDESMNLAREPNCLSSGPIPSTNPVRVYGQDLVCNNRDVYSRPTSQNLSPTGGFNTIGNCVGEGYRGDAINGLLPHGEIGSNLDFPSSNPRSSLPVWTQHSYDHNPNPSGNMPYGSVGPVQGHSFEGTFGPYADMRNLNSMHGPFRLPDLSNVGWNGSQESIPHNWQLMNSCHQVANWGFSAYPQASTTDLSVCNRNNTKCPKKLLNLTNVTNTHEDYQQDVLIQQEFQRLDEMLLRDDDDVSLSDIDQVSVESVVSSEQQYDSPWENVTEVAKNQKGSGTLAVQHEKAQQLTAATATESDADPNMVTNAASISSRVAAVVEEFRQNCEPVMMHSSQRMEQEKLPNPQHHHIPPSAFTNVGKSTTVRTVSTTTQAFEAMKNPYRPKTVSTYFEIQQQQQQQHPQQPSSQQRRYPLEGTSRVLEQKRTLERVRIEELRVTDRPAVQTFKACTADPVSAPPLEFRSAPLPTRKVTPRLPRIRMDSQKRYPANPLLKRKLLPPTIPPSAAMIEPAPPPPARNIMGVSQGDGIWGPVPEMNARMYLPHGILLFKMEYQPNGSGTTSVSPRKPHQLQQPQPRTQAMTNLAKFTHPVIHMLPLSPDGSTRLNVTFDVIYQN